MSTVFVYAKDDKIKVLNTEVASESNDRLLKQGWKHTSTIDACRWIEIFITIQTMKIYLWK